MIDIINADCRAAMREMAAESVQCCVTSPPYWGLRDYGIEGVVWDGDADCAHEWGATTSGLGGNGDGTSFRRDKKAGQERGAPTGAFCRLCGAWHGCLGLEPTVDLFVKHMVAVFREVRRVLRPDGTVWLNLGDSYSAGKPILDADFAACRGGKPRSNEQSALRSPGLKPKDLIMVPHRVAIALQDDGWWVRSAIVWAKGLSFCPTYAGSVMPESCTDRPTSAYEMVFLLTKAARYYYDNDAVREAHAVAHIQQQLAPPKDRGEARQFAKQGLHDYVNPAGRNLRNVWAINPQPFPDAHFATFPEALVEPCIKAGSSPQACGVCGAPWERVVERKHYGDKGPDREDEATVGMSRNKLGGQKEWDAYVPPRTTGWRPTCECQDRGCVELPLPWPGCHCTVLDPFSGSGTVGLVAKRLGRDAILIDASAEYCDMARTRTGKDVTAEMFV